MCVCVCVCVRAGRLLPVGVHSRMTVPDQQCWGPWAYQLGSEEWTKLQSPPDPEACRKRQGVCAGSPAGAVPQPSGGRSSPCCWGGW